MTTVIWFAIGLMLVVFVLAHVEKVWADVAAMRVAFVLNRHPWNFGRCACLRGKLTHYQLLRGAAEAPQVIVDMGFSLDSGGCGA